MGEIKDMLLKAYLKKGAPTAKKAEKVVAPAKAPAPIPVERPKTLGNITLGMLAQKIYFPNMPPVPKSPSKDMMDKGVASGMSLDGPWGKPEDK
jgi:hypothetical protein